MNTHEVLTDQWRVTVLLCDFAQVAAGKLYLLGGGWSLCGPGPFQHGLAIKVEVPWTEANRPHVLEGVLKDADERSVRVGDPPNEVRFRAEFEVGRPPGLPAGTALDVPLAVNFGPLELPPGAAYFWSISVDGKELQRVRFRTRSRG
ncbi:MAG: hypothetical protein QN163_09275 [Armatimonadota bacterium]|nr:hypothetical protein [Armatimonadota bacterium]MDR5697995.1 hypothetical protein [Armatimonadota bacterium]